MRKHIMWRTLLLLFALLPSLASAGNWKSNSTPGYNVSSGPRVTVTPLPAGPLADLLSGRTYNPDVTEGSVLLRDLLKKTPTGKGLADVGIAIERKATGKALATAAARALPVVGAAVAVAEVLDAMGCTISTTTIIECEGTWEEQAGDGGNRWCVVGASGLCFDSFEDAKRHYVDFLNAGLPGTVRGVKFETGSCTLQAGSTEFNRAVSCTSTLGEQFVYCPPPIDAGCWQPNGGPQVSGVRYFQVVGPGPELRCEGEASDGGCVTRPSPEDFGEKAENNPTARPKLPGLGPALDAAGVPYETTDPEIDGPAVIPGGRVETRQNPDGSTTTVDRDYPTQYSGPGDDPFYEWGQRDVTKTWPPGVTPTPYDGGGDTTPPEGGSSSSSTTTVEVKTCGLPNTPPCKIDESGTPPPDDRDPTADADSIMGQWRSCVTNPSTCLPALPSLNWTFTLPSTCTAIPLPAFADVGLAQLDLCQFQSTFHDLMSVVWVAAGVFGAIRLFTRDAVGS